jgi:hypothetical protein
MSFLTTVCSPTPYFYHPILQHRQTPTTVSESKFYTPTKLQSEFQSYSFQVYPFIDFSQEDKVSNRRISDVTRLYPTFYLHIKGNIPYCLSKVFEV